MEKKEDVPVAVLVDLDFEDPVLIALRAITSLSRKGYEDPLLLGLIYRRWRGYEDSLVPLRAASAENQYHRQMHGMTLRESYHQVLTRRLGRSLRELERLASVLDIPPEWLRVHRAGQVSLQVLERIRAFAPADQDDLTEELR